MARSPLIGAGGVGKAIAFALASSASPACASSTASRPGPSASGAPRGRAAPRWRNVEDALDGAGGVVNGTPIGMLPNRGSPVPANLLHENMWVADAVYSPLITPLLAAATGQGRARS